VHEAGRAFLRLLHQLRHGGFRLEARHGHALHLHGGVGGGEEQGEAQCHAHLPEGQSIPLAFAATHLRGRAAHERL